MIIQIIGETLADYRIGKVDQWDQLFSDGTGMHQTDLHNFIIGVIDEEHLHPLTISNSVILKREMSEQQVDNVLSTIVSCRNRLHQGAEMLEH